MAAPFDDDQLVREKNGATRKPTSQKKAFGLTGKQHSYPKSDLNLIKTMVW